MRLRGERFFERFSTARQTRICHEIFVGVEGFFARRGLYARGTAIRQELPALLVVLEIGDHNLAENLFVHGGIEIGDKTSTRRSRLRGIMSADEI